MINYEEGLNLNCLETFEIFSNRINSTRTELMNLLNGLEQKGKTIAGYGGSATTATLIYHFGLGQMLVHRNINSS